MGPSRKRLRQQEQQCLQVVLRYFRQEAGLRQVDLARLIDEPQSFVSKYESGERRLDILELRLICRALGITPTDVVGRLEGCITGAEDAG
jgi:transcriptional regulator with XRE-family HTH domain